MSAVLSEPKFVNETRAVSGFAASCKILGTLKFFFYSDV